MLLVILACWLPGVVPNMLLLIGKSWKASGVLVVALLWSLPLAWSKVRVEKRRLQGVSMTHCVQEHCPLCVRPLVQSPFSLLVANCQAVCTVCNSKLLLGLERP